jgi:hypothetical protein
MSRRPAAEYVRGRRGRRVGTRAVRQRFLIVCEGERTEPQYFKDFQVPGLVVTVKGVARSALQLVEEARKHRDTDDYDQVWCVFDRDDCEPDHIHRAFELARRLGFGIAFSNQAFELWYLLHFDYHHVALTRPDYGARLSQQLGRRYVKNSSGMYLFLLARQPMAIANARRLMALYDQWRPAHDDPSTTVHELVEELNKHRRP